MVEYPAKATSSIRNDREEFNVSVTTQWVKERAAVLGADLCGVADADGFSGAPEGFHPRDVLPGCRTVVVLAKRFLSSTLSARSTIPYTDVRNRLTRFMDDLSIALCYELEDSGLSAVPVNAIGPTEWDARTGKSRGIISLKHAGELAGLGRIGKNTLLVTPKFGNMVWLGAVITDATLEADRMAPENPCLSECRKCLDACPVHAMDGVSMDQRACWEHAFGPKDGGEWRIKCHTCRSVCPNRFGMSSPPADRSRSSAAPSRGIHFGRTRS
mgnify:CR=1 FL=1